MHAVNEPVTNLIQNFESWPYFWTYFGGLPYGDWVSPSGWKIHAGHTHQNGLNNIPEYNAPPLPDANGGVTAGWIEDHDTVPNPSLTSTLLLNGVGAISFYAINYRTGENFFDIQISSNEVDWATLASMTNTAQVWTRHELTINNYDNVYLRIEKTGDTASGNQMLGLDDIALTKPAARVQFSGVATIPATVYVNSNALIQVTITPQAEATNIAATLYYSVRTPGSYSAIGMTNGAGNTYTTTSSIPVQAVPGTPVYYYVEATFEGPASSSPLYYPSNGASDPEYYVVRQPDHYSPFSEMKVIGGIETNLLLVGDQEWFGVAEITGSLVAPSFSYWGTNGAITVWGDDTPTPRELPVFGFGNTGGASIDIQGTVTGTVSFYIGETDVIYNAQQAMHLNFDSWAAAEGSNGVYTNAEGWVIGGGMTTPSASSRTFGGDGRSLALQEGTAGGGGGPATLPNTNLPAWTPDYMSAAAWFDASDETTIASPVSEWRDKSGNNNHVSQGTSDQRPGTGSKTINGLNAIAFDGSNDGLATTGNPFGASVSDAAVFVVAKSLSVSANGSGFSLTGAEADSSKRWQSHMPWGGGTVYFDCGGAGGANRLSTGGFATANENWLATFYCSVTDNKQEVWKNGSILLSDTSGHTVSTAGNVMIGRSEQNRQHVAIGEFIVINGTVSTGDRQSLEGYLAHKWGLAGSLPGAHPYKGAPPPAWSPSNITTEVWLDASDASTVVTAATVDQWNDKSGNGNHVTAGASPVSGTRTLNGLNVIDFDNNDYLENTANIAAQPYSYALVAGVDNPNEDNTIFDANGALRSLVRHNTSGQLGMYAGAWGPSASGPLSGNFLVAGTFNGASSEIRVNGAAPGTGNPGTGSLSQGITIGNNATPTTTYDHDGIIGEIVIGSGVWTTTERQKVEGYLAHKWGLTGDLPGSHPYKDNFPLGPPAASGYGSLFSTQTTAANNDLDVSTPIPLKWSPNSANSVDTNVLIHSTSANSEIITINADGDYLVSYTALIYADQQRATIRCELYLNGSPAPGSIGESAYVRDQQGHLESSDHCAVLLAGLVAGDQLELRAVKTAAEESIDTVTLQRASIFVEQIPAGRTVFAAGSTGNAAGNINNPTDSPMNWDAADRKDSGFTHSAGNSAIGLNGAGTYLVFVNIPLHETGADNDRPAPKLRVKLNGTLVPGGEAKQGYIRTSDGSDVDEHDRASIHWSGVVISSGAGVQLTIETVASAAAETVTIPAGKEASIYIEKLNASQNIYFGRATDRAGDWNLASPGRTLDWDTDEVIDTNIFTHATTKEITVNEDGDYLLVYNDCLTSGSERFNPLVEVLANGVPVPGAVTKSHYIRAATTPHFESSGSLVFLLHEVLAGTKLAVRTYQSGNTGGGTSDQDALLMLWYKSTVAGGGGAVTIEADGPYIASPYLPGGIGEVSFWYRNWWDATNFGNAGFLIEKSADQTNWVTIATETNILSMDYLHYSLPLSDRDNFYLRILSPDNATAAQLCLDNITVARPGPGVLFSNVEHSPTNPTILESVNVQCNITVTNGASDLHALVWYRAGTNGAFDYSVMTNSGSLYVADPPIPQGEVGTMQYYIECSFQGAGRERVSAFYPVDGSATPINYPVTETFVIQDFEAWPYFWTYFGGPLPYGDWTSADGWKIFAGHTHQDGLQNIPDYGALPNAHSPVTAAWLEDADVTSPIALMSPLITNGVGSVSFWLNNLVPGDNVVELQVSTNSSGPWTTLQTFTHSQQTWGNYSYALNTETNYYVRINKVSDDAIGHLIGIDDVLITFSPAQVEISDIMTHPGYPAEDQPVELSCVIQSANPAFPAFGIQATLWYRTMQSGPFTPVPMDRSGSYFRTRTAVPGQLARTKVEYYIEATFYGYHGSPRDNHSPSFYPAGTAGVSTNQYFLAPTNSAASYEVRNFRSIYDHLEVAANVGAVPDMELVGNSTWQGVYSFPPGESTNEIRWRFEGLSLYTNDANQYASITNVWGDNDQPRDFLPLSGWGETNGAEISVTGTFTGQILFRYNVADNTYIVARGAYQDFDEWFTASSDYFDDSLGYYGVPAVLEPLNGWPVSVQHVASRATADLEDFQGWTPTNQYYLFDPPTLAGDMNHAVSSALIVEEIDTNRAARLHEITTLGRVWPRRNILPNGLGTYSFRYRWASSSNEHDEISYFPGTTAEWNDYAVEATLRSADYSPHLPSLQMLAKFTDEDRYYAMRLTRERKPGEPIAGLRTSIWKANDPTARVVSAWFPGSLNADNECRLVATTNNGGSIFIEASCNDHPDSVIRWVDTSPGDRTDPTTIAFMSRNTELSVDNVRVSRADAQHFRNWTEGAPGTYTNNGWIVSNGQPQNDGSDYWCYLPQNAAVRSPALSSAMGRLSLEYASDSGGSATCQISASPDGSSWTLVDTISGVTDTNNRLTNYTFTASNNYRYLAVTNTGVGDLRLAAITRIAVTNIYTNDFLSPAGIGDWVEAAGYSNWVWNAVGKTLGRPGYIGPPVKIDIDVAATNGALPDKPTQPWTTIESVTADSLQYQTHTVTLHDWERQFIGLHHDTGAASAVVDDLTMNSWRATNYTAPNAWSAAETWIVPRDLTNTALEFWTSRAPTSQVQFVKSPVYSNGIGSVILDYKCENGPATLKIQSTLLPTTNSFQTWHTVVVTNTSWANARSYQVKEFGQHIVRIIHDTPTNASAILSVDNIRVSDHRSMDDTMWRGYNTHITHTRDDKEFEPHYEPAEDVKTCYINTDPSSGTDGETFDADMAYLESPYMPYGIGEVSFWIRAFDGETRPSTLIIRSAPTRDTPTNFWTTLAVVTGITDTAYTYFTTNYYRTGDHFVRISCPSNDAASFGRICLDNVVISEPIGANFDIGEMTLYPTVSNSWEQPLYSDEVDVSVKLSNFTLQPSNIDVRLYYYVNTNYPDTNYGWGNFPMDTWIQMTTNGQPPQTYRTLAPIPRYEIDDIVQYRVEATFEGRFSYLNSPKVLRDFVNPVHYSPIDLNAGQSITNPYYFVFSCLPGDVWFNEYNVVDMDTNFMAVYTNQYIELAGKMGSDVRNWRIDIMNGLVVKDTYLITNNTRIENEIAGYGFWLLGTNSIPGIDQALTNEIDQSYWYRLTRSIGTREDAVTNAGGPHPDNSFASLPVSMVGTSDAGTGFTWVAWNAPYTPGYENTDQGFILFATTQELVVASQQGGAIPPIGTNEYVKGSKITAMITNSPVYVGVDQTQYVCVGWSSVGNVPLWNITRDPTNTTEFVLLTDSTLTWTWQTNVYLDAAVNGNGSLSTNGWVEKNQPLALTAIPDLYHEFVSWSGDTLGIPDVTAAQITLPMAGPRGPLVANFQTTDKTLDVSSLYALGLAPPIGLHTNHYNDLVTCIVSNRYLQVGGTQYVAVSWNRTGDVPPAPTEGPSTNLYWTYSMPPDTYNSQMGIFWRMAIYRDGGNWLIDPICSNGVSAGDDELIVLDQVNFADGTRLYWPPKSISVDRGLRVFTAIFNNANISNATHYLVPDDDLFQIPETGQPPLWNRAYSCGTASSNEWTALLAPTNITLRLSTGPFNITNHSSINWIWSTNYLLSVTTNGPGTVEPAGWLAAGTSVTITATATPSNAFDQWSGNTNGIVPPDVTSTQITFTMTAARSLIATFTGGATATAMGTPYSWLNQYFASPDYWDTNDFDSDGLLGWQEYITGTDPTNHSSAFRVLEILYTANSNKVVWYATTNSGVNTPFGIYRSTNLLDTWGAPYATNIGPRSTNGTNTWWDTNLPAGPVYYRPFISTTNGP